MRLQHLFVSFQPFIGVLIGRIAGDNTDALPAFPGNQRFNTFRKTGFVGIAHTGISFQFRSNQDNGDITEAVHDFCGTRFVDSGNIAETQKHDVQGMYLCVAD